jgi:hypothetical protein
MRAEGLPELAIVLGLGLGDYAGGGGHGCGAEGRRMRSPRCVQLGFLVRFDPPPLRRGIKRRSGDGGGREEEDGLLS